MHWLVRVRLKNQIHYAGAHSLKPLSKSLVVRAEHFFRETKWSRVRAELLSKYDREAAKTKLSGD